MESCTQRRRDCVIQKRVLLTPVAAVLMLGGTHKASPAPEATAQPPQAQSVADEPNPAYLGWAAFPPGAWVVTKFQSSPGGQSKETLKSISPSEALVEVRYSVEGLGALPRKTESIPARVLTQSASNTRVKKSRQSITINGKRLHCRVERGPSLALTFVRTFPAASREWKWARTVSSPSGPGSAHGTAGDDRSASRLRREVHDAEALGNVRVVDAVGVEAGAGVLGHGLAVDAERLEPREIAPDLIALARR